MEQKSRGRVGGGTCTRSFLQSSLPMCHYLSIFTFCIGISTVLLPSTAAGGYRGGTRKGLDLTIAGPIPSIYFKITILTPSLLQGGILLRTIQRKSDAVVISGPLLLINEILRVHGAHNISELVHSIWGGNTMALQSHRPTTSQTKTSCMLSLRPSGSKDAAPVYTSSRIGLDPSHPKVIYLAKRYRYFVHPHLLTTNGRGHTSLGAFLTLTCGESSNDDKRVLKETIKITGLKEYTALKYLADYRAGVRGS